MVGMNSISPWEELPVLVATGLACLTAAVAAIVMTREPGGIATISLAGAIQIGMMLRKPNLAWWVLAVGGLARLLAGVVVGDPITLSMSAATANVVSLGMAYYLLRRQGIHPVGLPDLRNSLWVLFWAALFAPALGGLIGAALSALHFPGLFQQHWLIRAVASSFGALVLLPVLLAYTPGALSRLWKHVGPLGLLLAFSGSLLVSVGSILYSAAPFVLLGLPLILVAFIYGRFGTTLICAVNVLALVAVRMAIVEGAVAIPGAWTIHASEPSLVQFTFYCSLVMVTPTVICIEVARRRRAHWLLEKSEKKFRWLADNTPALIAVFDKDGRFAYGNEAHRDLLGVAPDLLYGKGPEELFAVPAIAQVADAVAMALEGVGSEREVSLPDGRILQATLVPGINDFPAQVQADADSAGALLLAVDITRIKLLQAQLHAEMELAQVTLGSIADAVVSTGRDGRVRFMNRVAEDMTGWSLSEAQGRPLDEVLRLEDAETGAPGLSPMQIAMDNDRALGLAANTSLIRRDGYRSPIEDSAAPIHDTAGTVIGGVMVFHDVSESRAMAIKMSHLAQHDYLTDLPNRILLRDRLEQALVGAAHGRRGALLFIDIDHFKHINDSLGHTVGDLLLQAVARRLAEAIRPDDTISRQGGDEFVVLLSRLGGPDDAARVAEKLLEQMAMSFVVEGHELQVTISIGISLFPEDSADPEILMKFADAALYHSKESGRARFKFYAEDMSAKAERRLKTERELRHALKHAQLRLHFQTKVASGSRQVVGMEALVRWQRTSDELVHPGDFIGIAEDCGLIDQIDEWVLREACRQNRAWLDAGLSVVPVAVNVSLARFDGERLLRLVSDVLAESGLESRYLQVEMTETHALHDTAQTQVVIDGLRHLGVQVSMDDFGTGYSSLSYLQKFRFDVIKIDRAFVTAIENDTSELSIVRAIIAIAHGLKCRVVAEGVETEIQAATLQACGCEELQGYLFSRPMEAEQAAELLSRR